MSDIFISYASEDKKIAKTFAEVFEQQGWSVWWDSKIPPGKSWPEMIEEALSTTKCVVALWSKASKESKWVKKEARYADQKSILIPVLIENVKVPFEFDHLQAAQFIDWKGEISHPEVNKLIGSIVTILGHPRVEKKKSTAIKKTETETPKQVHPKHKPEAVDKKKPPKEQELKKPGTSAKRSRLIWLLLSILVPFIGGMFVLGIYLDKSRKTVPPKEIIKQVPIEVETVTQTSVPEEEVFEKPDTPEDGLSEKTKDSKPSTKTKKPEPIVNETVKEPDVPETEIIEQPAITKKRFRSRGLKLFKDGVMTMIERYNFYCKENTFTKEYSNPKGKGFKNKFEEQIKKGDKVILDQASGLMWQQNGSRELMAYEETLDYVEQLNILRFAGYNDWRLPTLEEAMSLMEPEVNSDEYNVDSVFDSEQERIWTSDLHIDSAWVVYYFAGYCTTSRLSWINYYVRAVRNSDIVDRKDKSLRKKNLEKEIEIAKPIINKEKEATALKNVQTDKEEIGTSVVPITKFRSTLKENLSRESVKSMLHDKGFYDRYYNKSASGFSNDYKLQNGEKVIYDRASGLMWQRSGSNGFMVYEEARWYILGLNSDKYAGYNDWRLPTIEEAMSLIEPTKKNGDLYIDPLFDKTQRFIWTLDMLGTSFPSGAPLMWKVSFTGGYCAFTKEAEGYVRAVRSGQ